MVKKNFKLLALLLVILTIVSSFSICFADEENSSSEDDVTPISEDNPTAATSNTNAENVYNGDLYLFESNVTMDKLVDGNVYIFGNNVTVTGQVNGNLFIMGNSIKLDQCYVRYSIYALGNDIYYNGACNDLYALSQKLELTYNSYVVRDVKASANSTVFKSAIGRDVDLKTSSVDFGNDSEVPLIYGNLRYSADSEKTLADGVVEGETTYTSNNIFASNKSVGEKILSIVSAFLLVVVTSLVIYALLNKFNPECVKKLNYSPISLLKAFGIGLLTIIAGALIALVLFITSIGAKLGLIVSALLVLLGLLSTPIVAILVTNLLKPVVKAEKAVMYYIVLALVSIVLYGLTLIPFVGGLISFIIIVLGYGLIVRNFVPEKELTPEELAAKEDKKQAKLTAKAEKKEAKLAAKAKKKEAKAAIKTEKESKKTE